MSKRTYLHRGHTITDIKYHFVWATKYRYPVLLGRVGTRARDLIQEVCRSREITIVKGVVSRDHVHIFTLCPPHLAPAKVMQWVKGKSSRRLQEEFPELRRRYWGQHLWARGYFCASAGTVTDEMIAHYLDHHTTKESPANFPVEVPE